MFGMPRPLWIFDEDKAVLMDRLSGCAFAVVETVAAEEDYYFFDVTIYLGPIGRYRFWRALIGGPAGLATVGQAYPHESLASASLAVAKALREIGVLRSDGHIRSLEHQIKQMTAVRG